MEILVTGMGAVSPYGLGVERLWQGVSQGESPLRPITRFETTPYRNALGGEVPDLETAGEERAIAMACLAAREALTQAGIDATNSGRIGLALGTNFGGMEVGEAAVRSPATGDCSKYLGSAFIAAIHAILPLTGPRAMISLACASGAATLGVALEWLRAGRADMVLAGGVDELSETSIAGLSALRAITQAECIRPWDLERGGTLFSEGAGLLVLETAAHALARGAKGSVRLLGRGINNDAFHMTAPDKTGHGIAAVMRMALADAGLAPEAIDHLNLHGTGTKYNDLIETTAIRTVFGAHTEAMRFTANKSLFGHAMGAAGALEAIVTCKSLMNSLIPPTCGCINPDPEIPLPLVRNTAESRPLRHAMTNSYGLGGTNASLVFGKV